MLDWYDGSAELVEGAALYVEPHVRLDVIGGYARDGAPLFDRVPLAFEAHNSTSRGVPAYPAAFVMLVSSSR
jgi:hypothetical protein